MLYGKSDLIPTRLWQAPLLLAILVAALGWIACNTAQGNPVEAPPAAKIVPGVKVNLFSVEHPEQFAVAEALQASQFVLCRADKL
jgi:hypothetical protein